MYTLLHALSLVKPSVDAYRTFCSVPEADPESSPTSGVGSDRLKATGEPMMDADDVDGLTAMGSSPELRLEGYLIVPCHCVSCNLQADGEPTG